MSDTFGGKLREARKKAGYNGANAAESVGISKNYLYRCERNEDLPSLELVIELSHLYGDDSIITSFTDQDLIMKVAEPKYTIKKEGLKSLIKKNSKNILITKIERLISNPDFERDLKKFVMQWEKESNEK